MPALSLRAKLMLSVTAVMVASSILLTIFIDSRMSSTLKAELQQRGVAIAHELAAQSVDLVLTYNTYQLHELVHTIQASNKDIYYVFITDSKGRLLVHTFEAGFPLELLRLNGPVPGQDQRTSVLNTDRGTLLDVAVPVYQGKGGIAHVGMSYEQVWRTIDDTVRWLWITGGVGLVIAWTLTYLSVGMVLRPLGNLMTAVQEVRRGNLHHRAGVKSRDEIGRFGVAFDAMAEDNAGLIEQTREHARQLAIINAVAAAVNESPDLDDMLTLALRRVLDLVNLEAGGILLWNDVDCDLAYRVHHGFLGDSAVETRVRHGGGMVRRVIETGETLILEDVADDPQLASEVVGTEGFHFMAGIPLSCKGRTFGVLQVASHARHRLPQQEQDTLVTIGRQLGVAIENLRLIKEASDLAAQARVDRLRSEFLARASHELRTPVAAIQGYVETLMREDMALDGTTQRALFQDMEHISDRLSRLVHDLLNVSRIDVGELKLNKKPVALGPAIARAVRRFEMQTSVQTFHAQVPQNLPLALADPDLLDDILDNLLSNAVKYSSQETTVTVTAQAQGMGSSLPEGRPVVVVSVKDEGTGIPAAELDKLFQRFYQRSDSATTIRVRGIGLGLYLCKTYVEAMGGTIWVESEPGRGSSFTFTLPTVDITSSRDERVGLEPSATTKETAATV